VGSGEEVVSESGDGVLGERQRAPSQPASGLGSAVSSRSGVWGGAPAEIEFDAFSRKIWHLAND